MVRKKEAQDESKSKKKENLHEGHRDRVRERFIKDGLDGFEPHEVLQLLLFYVIPQKDTNVVGHRLITQFGSLAGVFEANTKDLLKVEGMTQRSAVLLSIMAPLARYYFNDKWKPRERIDSTRKAAEILMDFLVGYPTEVFCMMSLDAQNRMIHKEVLHVGTISEAPVYPRIVVEAALRHQATAVILCHNHPGGSIKISLSDKVSTDKIKVALDAISIKLLDHVIVAGDRYSSFLEEGLL